MVAREGAAIFRWGEASMPKGGTICLSVGSITLQRGIVLRNDGVAVGGTSLGNAMQRGAVSH